MRKVFPVMLDAARLVNHPVGPSRPGDLWGFFVFLSGLRVMSSGAAETAHGEAGRWEHVSVSWSDRIPTWDEMQWVKEVFWSDEECVVQYHPPKADYVNNNPHVLHLWKPPYTLPLPPKETIG